MNPVIEVESVSKRYRLGQAHETMLREAIVRFVTSPVRSRPEIPPFWALRDVSFSGQPGEVIGIIGRNGAGKSTLLKVLSKITHPTSGHVKVRGRVASLLEVGTGFHEELTGRENIYLNGSILGMKKKEIETKLDEIVDFSGVERFIDTPLKHYSSGMALRLGFAVAAHLETDVLMVDEVLAVGDVEFQKKCMTRMEDLHSAGRTVIFISHNLAAVEHFCPRVIWIDQGRIREDGKAADVIHNYMGMFTACTTPSSELDKIQVREGNGDVRFTAIEILGLDRQPKPITQSGDALVFRLHYRASRAIPEPHFGIRLHSDFGLLVTDFSTWSTGRRISRLPPGEGSIEVEIPMLNLMPGQYSISLWLTRSVDVNYDIVENCAVLEVEGSDFYGTGRGIDRHYGIMFLPCTWSLNGQKMMSSTVSAETR
jgi:lipopolysaccharide transport system ATP-binding protein